MAKAISLIFMFICAITPIYSQELAKKFRRFELTISGFSDKQNDEAQSLDRYVEVKLNDHIVMTKKIEQESSDYDNNYFIYNVVGNQYDIDMDLNGYFEENQTLNSLVFNGPVRLNLLYFEKRSQNEEITIAHLPTENDIRCAANADWNRQVIGNRASYHYFVSYWCRGYTGKGCQFECDDSSTSKYECFYDTGKKVCKDINYDNPPDCDKQITTCDVNSCKNGGTCVKVYEGVTYCECTKGWMGDTCQLFVCDPLCNPDFGTCTGPNNCTCVTGKTGPTCTESTCDGSVCEKGGICSVIKNEAVCNCNPSSYAGKKCELECVPKCVYGTCVEIDNEPICQCFEGFDGGACENIVEKPAPIFQKGYVSKKDQKAAFIGITVGLIVLAIILFGIGAYIRNHRMRNLKIIKGTEMAIQTIQMAQQQTLLNNALQARAATGQM